MSEYDAGGFLQPAAPMIGEAQEGELILTAKDWERLRSGDDPRV